ncbi:MAG TPA: hypothetical protein DCS11_08730 [Syntrophus sp. (in: bacteria)]|nr:hypothetical protein [Syntrophus sp. (in: bacteria)]
MRSAAALLLVVLAASAAPAQESVVAFFAPLEVKEDARRDVTVLFGSLTVGGRVDGRVYVVGGTCTLKPGAVVRDLFILFGTLRKEEGAVVTGTETLIAPMGMEGQRLPSQIALALFWLFLAFILSAFLPAQMATGQVVLRDRPLLAASVGLAALVIFFLLFTLFFFMLQLVVGYPLLLSLLAFFFLAKAYGMVVVFWTVGALLVRRWGPVPCLFAGWFAVTLLRAVPYAGAVAGWLATLAALGVVLVQMSFRFRAHQSLFAPPRSAP